MKITIIGTGYVGLVTGTCLANLGHDVICLDVDEKKIEGLKQGVMPIFEPGLKEMVERNAREGRLSFTTDKKYAIENSMIIFIAVGTPPDAEGKADLKYVFSVAQEIGEHINDYKVIIDKSTVPVGTADKVKEIIASKTKREFDVVSNPEFLREGTAIKDFLAPDRIVVGVESDLARELMRKIYTDLERVGRSLMFTDVKSAELIKYASNAMLATRISFMNMLAPLCEKIGADVKAVAVGMGFDSRIGPRFLQAGIGYGGSCFPKDVMALLQTLKENGMATDILDAVHVINERQKSSMIPKIARVLGEDLTGKTIGMWGLAFKPNTDDMREAPSIVLVKELQKRGAKIKAFDPVAMEVAKEHMTDVEYYQNQYEALEGCDALLIATEWDAFRNPDFERMKSVMKTHHIFDGRNIYQKDEIKKQGFNYVCVGR